MKTAGWALLLTACSEYQIAGDLDPGLPTDPELGQCAGLDTDETEVSVDDECYAEANPGTFTPVVEWRDESLGSAYTTPVVGHLTDDDLPDIVAVSSAGTMMAFSGDGQGAHWSVPNLGAEPSTAAIGDLDGDGQAEVAVGGNGFVGVVRGDTGEVLWKSQAPAIGAKPVCGGVGIYDLEGDGQAEVVVGNLIFDGRTGDLRGNGAHGIGTGHSSGLAVFGVAADVDADGDQEVVVGNALYDADGNALWYNGEPDGFVAVANFDDDDRGEIVVTWYPGNVRLQDDDGTVLWKRGPQLTGPTVGPPTVADFDGDGEPEIGVAGNNVYLVLETDGSVKWENPVQDVSSGFTGSSVFDFEGDGKAEVVYADENDVWVFDGETGAVKLKESEHSSATCSEYPSVADVDADGHAEIVYTSSAYSGQQNGLRVIGDADDSWMAGREVWNQHAYAITNVEDDGGIPTFPQPNWPAYNNFRSGDVTAVTGNGETDAVILANACDLECAEDRLFVVVRVGNEGTSDLPEGIPVAVYTEEDGEDVLLDTWTTEDEVDPGETTEPHVFALDADDVGDELWVVVDDDGTGRGQVQECDERNNDVEIEASCSAR